ncbi:MAG: endonuclease domain-containing protein [Ruminococcus sp.]|nr:endonuclease domain-containing protein [Ruminococcus sp.]
MKSYRQRNVPLASELRQNMTKYEKKLWFQFLRTCPVRFQRQKPIGRYIVDFYCAKAKLVIELDGSGHYMDEQKIYDSKRTAYLERMGLRELRYTNLQIAREFRKVCEDIYRNIESYIGTDRLSTNKPVKGTEGELR